MAETYKPLGIDGFMCGGTVRMCMGTHTHLTVVPSNAEASDDETDDESDGPNPNYGTL